MSFGHDGILTDIVPGIISSLVGKRMASIRLDLDSMMEKAFRWRSYWFHWKIRSGDFQHDKHEVITVGLRHDSSWY